VDCIPRCPGAESLIAGNGAPILFSEQGYFVLCPPERNGLGTVEEPEEFVSLCQLGRSKHLIIGFAILGLVSCGSPLAPRTHTVSHGGILFHQVSPPRGQPMGKTSGRWRA
jgi:hypothetical protein